MPKKTHSLRKHSRSSSVQRRSPSNKSRREVSAGGLVYRRTSRGIVFAMVIDSYGKLTFPKGHVARGESLVRAAKREVCEETSICGLRKVARLGKIKLHFRDRFKHKGALIDKDVFYFLFEARSGARIRVPRPKKPGEIGERIQRGFWVSARTVLKRSDYDDMQAIVKKALQILNQK